ncbi:unnamed protein product [Danaus chrysippus]|uniref:(African queen) hypothetical protein n=1 Tax=Danaus chrysippus TaxID=151541 RepID=A0A8J2QLV2_9NEOP|nr:unnamed protein product [Danaus chrysippus]
MLYEPVGKLSLADCVYFETSSTSPYQIRRIEELNKTSSGNVEAKVMCFYRRRDLPNPLIQLADKHQIAQSEDSPVAMKLKKICLKTPIGEEQAAQAVLDPAIGENKTHYRLYMYYDIGTTMMWGQLENNT